MICKDKLYTKYSHELSYIPETYPKSGNVVTYESLGNYDIENDRYGSLTLRVNIVTENSNIKIIQSSVESTEVLGLRTMLEGGKIEVNTIRGPRQVYIEPGIQVDDYKILDGMVRDQFNI
jgi:DnaJ-class molecular chaperone